jgi:hypothetical protein
VTRWPARADPRALSYPEAIGVLLGCLVDPAGRPLPPPWMSVAQAEDFQLRWRQGGARLLAEHPGTFDLLVELFGAPS